MRRSNQFQLAVGIGTLAGVTVFALATPDIKPKPITPEQSRFFENKVRPLLVKNCQTCHGEKDPKGSLRLDSAVAMLKGGARGAVVFPGDPEKSPLIKALTHDGSIKMPPTGKLAEPDIAIFTEWVKMGAMWPDEPPTAPKAKSNGRSAVVTAQHRNWWSFRPILKPAPPKISNPAWIKNPIDAFILARLDAKGLKPAPPASKRHLIRRAYFDLIGLPPTPEEVEAFINDKSPGAFEKVVNHLLASPHYGERWGRHWLDTVRYADSNGLDENKAFANAFRYRDYVVNAFNKDKTYDQFLREQLAGDLLPFSNNDQRNEQLTATGLLVLGPKVLAEQDKPKMVMDIVDEQIEVVSKSMLGLTVACARCHDHKFDPIPTADYYALAGVFKSTKTMKDLGFVSNWNERPLLDIGSDEKMKAHGEAIKRLEASLNKALEVANADVLDKIKRNAPAYVKAGIALAARSGSVSLAEAKDEPGRPQKMTIEAENFQRGNVNKDFETYGKGIGIIHNVGLPDVAEWDIQLRDAGVYQLEFRYASAEHRPVKLLINNKLVRAAAAGSVTGSFQPDGQRWEVQGRFAFEKGKNVVRIYSDSAIPHFDKLCIIPTTDKQASGPASAAADELAKQAGLEADILTQFAVKIAAVSPTIDRTNITMMLEKTGLMTLPEKPERFYSDSAKKRVAAADEALNKERTLAKSSAMVMAVEEDKVGNVRIHVRGDTQNLGAESPRRVLQVLSPSTPPAFGEKQSGRLELAEWLTGRHHPLTSRVAVNRVWQWHFGDGFVRTSENFGFLGDQPSHPELLDWLASAFMENDKPDQRTASLKPMAAVPSKYACGWSIKKLHKLIMLSNTYQMSVVNNQKASTIDAENRLHWTANRLRLEAEPFRDSLLAIAGTLDETMGGNLLDTPNNDYVTNDQSGNGARYSALRRSIYLPIIRNALYDMFQAFDMGDPSIVMARRTTTTVAQQALWVMNSATAVEQSRAFAQRLLKLEGTEQNRIDLAYRLAYSRPATAAEIAKTTAYLAKYESQSKQTETDPMKRRLKNWQSFCQILFSSNEFIYVD